MSERRPLGEDGFALASVVFLGAVMIMLTALIVLRSSAQTSLGAASADSDQSLYIAEGGLDEYLAWLSSQSDPDAVSNTSKTLAQLATRAQIVAEAELLAPDPANIVSAPEGDAVIVDPVDGKTVFAVVFTSPAGLSPRRGRVISAVYEGSSGPPNLWTADEAVLAGGDFEIAIQSSIEHLPPATEANLHANGSVEQTTSGNITGCASESVDSGYTQPGCTSPTPVEPLPVVDATRMHHLSWYDLCPTGWHYGPGHPTSPSGTAGTPCTGATGAGNPPGWRLFGTEWQTTAAFEGVFYVYDMDAHVKNDSAGAGATVIVDSSVIDETNAMSCVAFDAADLLQVKNGSTVTASSASITEFGGVGIALISEGAVEVGNNAIVTGLVLAREQFLPSNNAVVVGPIAAVDVCDGGLDYGNRFTSRYPGVVGTPFDESSGSGVGFGIASKSEITS